MKKIIYLLGSIILSTIFLGGCTFASNDETNASSTSEEEKSNVSHETNTEKNAAVELGDFQIYLGGEITETEDTFIIEGQSNLIPGARLIGEVIVNEDDVFSDTSELVDEDGSFYMELPHHQYGDAKITVRFDFAGVQDDEVKRHYGDKGQKLEGPYIYKHKSQGNIYKKAEISLTYLVNKDNKNLVFEEPQWNELPSDYGDPRVWIEVDTMEEDGEFFYLSGRSNLLEGSQIRAYYGNNRDDTSILPDGSFHFKINYEYRENTNFVIEFHPSRFQWNEVEEAYGKSGQKLIGNLVKKNRFNDNQYIEIEIPWDNN